MCIGTEVLIGDTLNTNGNYLARMLGNIGLKLSYELAVSDNKDDIAKSFHFFISNVDILIVSGGLGPTEDDKTKEFISEITGVSLIEDSEHIDWMLKRWKERDIKMPDLNRKQALIFKNFQGIPNTTGTALGAELSYMDTEIYLLPGPPREFKPMVEDYLIDKISNESKQKKFDYKYITLYGIPESTLAEGINKFKSPDMEIAYLPKYGVIKLRYEKNSIDISIEENFLKNMNDLYKHNIVSYSNDSLEKTLYKKMINSGSTLSIIESITGGTLSGKIASVPGSSKVFYNSEILYHNSAKEKFLEIKPAPKDWSHLSRLLSNKLLFKTETTFALAVLGEAGPISSSEYKVGEVFISVANSVRTDVKKYKFIGNREDVIIQSINQCLFNLIRRLN